MSTDNTTLNLWDEIFLITKGQKLTTDTALTLAGTTRYRMKNAQLKLPLKTLVNLLASAIANEVRENGIISNMSHIDIDNNINQRFEQELEDFVLRNAANVPHETIEYVGGNIGAVMAKAQARWSDFLTKTAKAMTTLHEDTGTVYQTVKLTAPEVKKTRKRPPSAEVLSLVCTAKCDNCNEDGYESIRYADRKIDNVWERQLFYGITHGDTPGNSERITFHRKGNVLSLPDAKSECKRIHQTYIPSPGASQLIVTGIVDEIPDPPARKDSPQNIPAPTQLQKDIEQQVDEQELQSATPEIHNNTH